LERNLAVFPACGAGSAEHFARSAAAASTAEATLRFTRGAAIGTTARGVGKSALIVEFLLTRGEYEAFAALAAAQGFVCVAQGMHSFIE